MSRKRGKRKIIVNFAVLWTATLVVLLDQISKLIAVKSLSEGPVEIIKGIFYLTLTYNTGAAFGIFKDQTILFIIISSIAVIGILVYIYFDKSTVYIGKLGFSFILGGAFGNLIDRLRFGYVIDFFDFKVWPVFNIADSAITIGAALLMISLLLQKRAKRN